jgi:hypothetical protein
LGLLADQLLGIAKQRSTELTVDGVTIVIREITAAEFAQYGMMLASGENEKAIAYLIARCVTDAEGGTVLTEEQARIVAGTARVGAAIVNAFMALSGYAEKKA